MSQQIDLSLKPHVARLFIYPFKSLDKQECDRVTILESGAIKGDRTWAFLDVDNKFVNGKRNSKIHLLRSHFDWQASTLTLQVQGTNENKTFNLIRQEMQLCNWLSEYFGFAVKIKQNIEMGFPDDTVSPGATIISTATLEAVSSWYPKLSLENVRDRFRANIEIDGVPAFWEDKLFSDTNSTVEFEIGTVKFMGVNPCQRCIVPTRHPHTGETYPQFQKIFTTKRKESLPAWANKSRFNHFFRLAVNTQLSPTEAGKVIAVADRIQIKRSQS
ncbi:MAG: MOSC N-terminal beta barrel domain-containing protein [Cyanobacteria bacterium P01_G01_bin.19]